MDRKITNRTAITVDWLLIEVFDSRIGNPSEDLNSLCSVEAHEGHKYVIDHLRWSSHREFLEKHTRIFPGLASEPELSSFVSVFDLLKKSRFPF